MRYDKPSTRHSFFGWLTSAAPVAQLPPDEGRLQRLRQRMLDELATSAQHSARRLSWRITAARDALTLWHCRIDLMQALCPVRGEAGARAVLADVTHLFEGLVPTAMTAASLTARRF